MFTRMSADLHVLLVDRCTNGVVMILENDELDGLVLTVSLTGLQREQLFEEVLTGVIV